MLTKNKFKIKTEHGGFVLIRIDFPYDFHAHIKTIAGCRAVLNCIEKGKMPKSDWLQGSCRRLLTEEEFSSLRKPKDKYYNSKSRRIM